MKTTTRKEQILVGAARLFRKRGFSATSMRDIAAELNIEAPSLYNHIKGKQEILQTLLLDLARAFTSGMDTIHSAPLTPEQKLERLVKLHVDLTVQTPNSMALITSEWIHLEEPAYKEFVTMRNDYEVNFRHILEEAFQAKGVGDANLDLALFSILSPLRWLYTWFLKNREVNPIELENEMVRNLLSGIFTVK